MELFKPEFGLVFWMFLAFVCLYFILAKWAWPFIIKSMDERATLIDEGVAYAQEAKSKLDNAKAEADALVADARKQQADILRDAAQVSIEQSRKESEHQLRQDVGAYALQIAEQVIRKNMKDDNAQRDLVKKLLNEVESNN